MTTLKHSVFTVIIGILSLAILLGCDGKNPTPPDDKYLTDFHNEYFLPESNPIEGNNLSLFVDYSTCMVMGLNSDFFQALVPSFVRYTKKYYSIKGDEIIQEEGEVYSLLRNIKEVNYANLEEAANRIASGNSEGVILTDGEYYKQSIAKSNVNNPYLTPAFKEWLMKGRDIYILGEPYDEMNKGKIYRKKRFYFLFTDSRLKGNIYEQIISNVRMTDFPEVSIFHLSASNPILRVENRNCTTPNLNLGCVPKDYGNFEIQNWQIDWESIQKIIMYGVDDQTGSPLPNGMPVISGLAVDRNSFGGLRIKNIDVKVYNINQSYFNYYSERETNVNPTKTMNYTTASNFIKLDKDEFENYGKIVLYLENKTPDLSLLDGSPYNFCKIDLCLDKVENNFNDNSEVCSLFEFDSIDLPGQKNVSIIESIKLCLSDSEILRKIQGQVIYSVYVISNKY